MGLFNDVKAAAKLDIDARKVLASYRLSKLDGEVLIGGGFQLVDIETDAAEVELDLGENWELRSQADGIIDAGSVACWESGYTLAEAAEMAAEREAADEVREDWAESRCLVA